MDRKKELKEEYKNYKSEMGIIFFKCLITSKLYLYPTSNIKGKTNSITFRLKNNAYTNKNLQNDWKEYTMNNFEIGVLDTLEYDKDENKTDYSKDLKELLNMHLENLDNYEVLK